jgi:molybdate transport system substrate-binding protein
MTILVMPAAALPAVASPQPNDIIVIVSGGCKSTYQALRPEIERETRTRLVTVPGPSMGTTAEAIPNRLARGEPDDVVVMVGSALDELAAKGEIVPGTKVEVALHGGARGHEASRHRHRGGAAPDAARRKIRRLFG